MLEFTSALYLGLRHPSRSLKPWVQLTTGVPAALAVPPAARAVARELAVLQGCQAATLGPSTVHLFWDLGEFLATTACAIYLDAGTYPIAQWGMERAAARGAAVRRFAHFDPDSLGHILRSVPQQRRPVVVSDGFCPGCGRPAPLAAYLSFAARAGGWLIIDDTQALGIFGRSPEIQRPYGEGGGGMPQWSNLSDPHLLVVSSLAKGFGAPLAALSGRKAFVKRFEELSKTRVHCSPPSLAAIHATEHALAVNRTRGEALRLQLAKLVRRFRERLRNVGLAATGGLFPIQTLACVRELDAPLLHARLLRHGVTTVLHQHHERGAARVSFLINARHTFAQIDQAADVLVDAVTAKERSHEQHLCV